MSNIVCCVYQVQDYYVVMRFNDRQKSMIALYRLFAASYMLRDVKVVGMAKMHNYPKMQLGQMCVLEHWRRIDHVVFKMMDGNIAMFNEE
jgi:hypothetical protein